MERVEFVLEPNDQRIACMLNPESLTVRRRAGVSAGRGGAIAGAGVSDDLLRSTGGGATEVELDLLFAAELLAQPQPENFDVRDWTRPLFELTENTGESGHYSAPRAARFLLGKTWNMRVVILAASERFGELSASGVPRRSWLKLLLRRVPESPIRPHPAVAVEAGEVPDVLEPRPMRAPAELDDMAVYETQGGPGTSLERLDQIAFRLYRDASRWRDLARWNDIEDPLATEGGRTLRVSSPGNGTTEWGTP